MSTSRAATGALFGLVASTAGTACAVLDSANTAVGMATAAINAAAEKQRTRIADDLLTYKEMYGAQKAREIVEHQDEIINWLGSDTDRKSRYEAALKQLRPEMV